MEQGTVNNSSPQIGKILPDKKKSHDLSSKLIVDGRNSLQIEQRLKLDVMKKHSNVLIVSLDQYSTVMPFVRESKPGKV